MIKQLLKTVGLYHRLQSFYRALIFTFEKLHYRYKYKPYAGSGFTCNVCGSVYKKFVPNFPTCDNKSALEKNNVIAGYGENILCPNCLSTARERLVIAYLQKEVNIDQKRILHLSPERNIYNLIKRKATITAADLLPGFYRNIDGMVQKQDATRLSYQDAQFDIIIANHILEHIPEDRKAIGEFFRVLKPGGIAILQVPYSETLSATIEDVSINDAALQSQLYGQKDHVRIYQLSDYVERIKAVGFDVKLLSDELQHFSQYAIQPREKFFVILKPKI